MCIRDRSKTLHTYGFHVKIILIASKKVFNILNFVGSPEINLCVINIVIHRVGYTVG